MVDLPDAGVSPTKIAETPWHPFWVRFVLIPKLRSYAARVPFFRAMVRRDQRKIFDVMAGFAYSQMLSAAVETDLFRQLMDGPKHASEMSGASLDAMEILCRAMAGLDFLKRRRDGRYVLTRLGVVMISVPGLETMVRHHGVLYRDLQNPLRVLNGSRDTEMAHFWPYVFGAASGDVPSGDAALYSRVMSDTQAMVAEQVLDQVSFSSVGALLDVAGGAGAFLSAVRVKYPSLTAGLFELPSVLSGAPDGFEKHAGSFRCDPLPKGYDCISLIRVLFDHRDETVAELLNSVHDALPDQGRVVIAEPMAGDPSPSAEGDAYYAIYTRAMHTGCTRTPSQISHLLEQCGFSAITVYPDRAPAIARVIEAKKG